MNDVKRKINKIQLKTLNTFNIKADSQNNILIRDNNLKYNDKLKEKINLLQKKKSIKIEELSLFHFKYIVGSFETINKTNYGQNIIVNNVTILFNTVKNKLANNKSNKNNNEIIFNESKLESKFYKRIFFMMLSFNYQDLIRNLKDFLNLYNNNKNTFALNFKQFSNMIKHIEKISGTRSVSGLLENLENYKFLEFKIFDKMFLSSESNQISQKILKIVFDSLKGNIQIDVNTDNYYEYFTDLKKFHSSLLMIYFIYFDNLITKKKNFFIKMLGLKNNVYDANNYEFFENSLYEVFKESLEFNSINDLISLKEIDYALTIFKFYHKKKLNYNNYNNMIAYISILINQSSNKKLPLKIVLSELTFYFCLQNNCNDIIDKYTYQEIYENKYFGEILNENLIWNEIKFEEKTFSKLNFQKGFLKFIQNNEQNLEISIYQLYKLYNGYINEYFPLLDKFVL